jgi:hypothetical protein
MMAVEITRLASIAQHATLAIAEKSAAPLDERHCTNHSPSKYVTALTYQPEAPPTIGDWLLVLDASGA